MKKTAVVALLMIVVMLVSATSGFAWVRGGGGVRHGGWNGHGGWHGGHGHGVVVVGPGCCWGPWWGWGWGGYYPGPYYYPQPQVVVQPAPVYTDSAPAQPAETSYWYYCASSKAYYPNVQNCGEAWIKVPPRSE
ncbi:MAG TPA: hypothetical protein VKH82_11875 [Candidatus Binatia bacterium]|nr:hypothetical protein [Candidatus Binatia bacterium]HKD00398.1 hypothetical protein [Methylomirabilota bacterium]